MWILKWEKIEYVKCICGIVVESVVVEFVLKLFVLGLGILFVMMMLFVVVICKNVIDSFFTYLIICVILLYGVGDGVLGYVGFVFVKIVFSCVLGVCNVGCCGLGGIIWS